MTGDNIQGRVVLITGASSGGEPKDMHVNEILFRPALQEL